MHEQEGTIQLFAAAKLPSFDILLQQIAEFFEFEFFFLLMHR